MIKHAELISCDLVCDIQLRSDLLQICDSVSYGYYALDVLIVYKEVPELLYEVRYELLHDILQSHRVCAVFCQIIPYSHGSYRKVLCLDQILLVKYRYLETSRSYVQKRPVLRVGILNLRLCRIRLVVHESLLRVAEH